MSKKGDPADIEEFGDADLAGSPTIAQLIRALPEDQREAYRDQRRAFVARACLASGKPLVTYAQYLTGG